MNPEKIVELLASGQNLPDIRELMSKIHAQLGGTDRVAELIADAIKAAPSGSPQQARMIGDYLSVISKVGGDEDLELATPEMLQRTAQEMIENIENDNGD